MAAPAAGWTEPMNDNTNPIGGFRVTQTEAGSYEVTMCDMDGFDTFTLSGYRTEAEAIEVGNGWADL